MYRLLLLLIIVVPAIEIGVLIIAGKTIGVWMTLLVIILTGVLGAWFAKKEGMQVIKLAQLQTQQGKLPSGVILDGICVLAGGIFLLAPGFITDAIGFFLLIPQTRSIAKVVLIKFFYKMIKNGNFIMMSRK